MTLPVEFLPGATLDFDESFDWYAKRSAEAARRFAAAIDSGIQRIVEQQDTFSFVDRRHQACPLKKFPFRIVYRRMPDRILIVAIAHAKRRPSYWRDRE